MNIIQQHIAFARRFFFVVRPPGLVTTTDFNFLHYFSFLENIPTEAYNNNNNNNNNNAMDDLLWRALSKADIPAVKELSGLPGLTASAGSRSCRGGLEGALHGTPQRLSQSQFFARFR